MRLTFFGIERDLVIGSYVLPAVVDYDYALQNLHPLIGRLDIQRDQQNRKFYSRLEEDLVKGCVMPTISIAMIHDVADADADEETVQSLIRSNIDQCFILDGIQRLSALKRASERLGFDFRRPCYVSFIVAGSRDRLLYRMITLNNGQRPMSARHQIDILADSFFDFENVTLKLVAEKGGGRVRAPDHFKKADFVKGYVAYLSGSVNIDNQKIIEEKMDELIASRIIDSSITTASFEFSDVVEIINRLSASAYLSDWIRNQNNFIGFCVGCRTSTKDIEGAAISSFEESIKLFEQAFSAVNVSKVNVGKVRRELVAFFIGNFNSLSKLEEFELLDKVVDQI